MQRLEPEALARRCDPASLPLESTHDHKPGELTALLGQERAAGAIDHALAVRRDGYHLFVMGPRGIGKTRFVRDAIHRHGARSERGDWVYVNRFERPERPLALGLPAGVGTQLRDDMRHLVDELKAMIPAAFEAESYAAEVERIQSDIGERHGKALSALNEEANQDGIALVQTPNGFSLAPMADGEVMPPDAFAKLPEDEQKRLRERIVALQEKLARIMREGMRLRKEQAERVRALNRETTTMAVGQAIDELRERYASHEKVVQWLEEVRADVLENAGEFLRANNPEAQQNPFTPPPDLGRYEVNLLSTPEDDEPAPVVEAEHPTLPLLLGRIDHRVQMGNLITDFRLIRGGLLHQANGGYLLIDALRLLTEPFAWQALKRALQRRDITIESIGEQVGAISTSRLEPEPIPLDVKVILFGERYLYYLLGEHDPDFRQLFRVVADFDDDLPRDAHHQDGMARIIAEQAQSNALMPIDRGGLARLIDQSARLADDATRLSANVQVLMEIATEGERLARQAGRHAIGADDIRTAVRARRERSSRAADHYRRAIVRGTLLIDTDGAKIGQVNGLAVYQLAGEAFGHPSRITATTRIGEGRVVDIQRETDMGGAIHSKGVLILTSFLAARYSSRRPLSMSASLVFEQSYGPVDGDSATIAEICALLSSLAATPIRQSLAVTGSMNQLGEVQAIGGVNEKIEGFFAVCRDRGLTGEQGVIIPAANVEHLMLDDEVVDAVREGKFNVWAVSHIDEALELLTGVPAGDVGAIPSEATVNGRVAERLREYFGIRTGARAGGLRAQRRGLHDI